MSFLKTSFIITIPKSIILSTISTLPCPVRYSNFVLSKKIKKIMKVALTGASGFVGTAILNELIIRGHQVTAIVRNPENIAQSENVKAITANALDAHEVAEAVKGHDAVISAYNAGWTNPNLYNEFLQGSKAIQEGVKKSG